MISLALNNLYSFVNTVRRNHVTRIGFRCARIIRTASILVFAFLSSGIKAQPCDTLANYFPGAVVLRKEKKIDDPGSILYGCIKLMNSQKMYVAPKLVDSAGKTESYFGREALAYWYVRNNDTIYYLNSGRNLKESRWIYLQRIVNGPMELYLFQAEAPVYLFFRGVAYDYYFIRKDGRWLNEKAIVWNEGGKRKQLQKIFSDCKPALELISNTPSLQLDEIIQRLVMLYNESCSGFK